MPRTASMTIDQAENLLGNRVTFVCDSTNRNLVRKWAIANGWKSKEIYRLKNNELERLYRTGEFPTQAINGHEVPTASNTNDAVERLNGANGSNDAGRALAEMIRLIAGEQAVPVNKSQVREMVADMIGDALDNFRPEPAETVHKLEVTTASGNTVKIDGLSHYVTQDTLTAVSLGHPVMLIGPAGCGKTTVGDTVAKALELDFYITSIVFDTHELMGFVDGHGVYHSTAFRQAFEHGGVWVADEIDAWDAAALLAANSALANGFATFPDCKTPVRRHANFRIIATANTYGHGADRMYVGRNELDAATLDRFATIDVDYDDMLESALSINPEWLARVRNVRQSVRDHSIRHVVSTRAIIMGQTALSAGMKHETVEALYLFKGMSKTDRQMIER